MTLHYDLFWSFRSPYSYLAIGRYRALVATHDLIINLRPVYPLAIRQPEFFERNHPNWLRYTMLDMLRVAQFEGIPFGPPRPDPIVQDVATRRIAEDQPYIRRITRLGQAAARRGKGEEPPDRRPLADNVAEQAVEAAFVGNPEHVVKGFRQRRIALGLRCREQAAPCFRKQAGRRLVVQHAEMAGDIGFQRKLM